MPHILLACPAALGWGLSLGLCLILGCDDVSTDPSGPDLGAPTAGDVSVATDGMLIEMRDGRSSTIDSAIDELRDGEPPVVDAVIEETLDARPSTRMDAGIEDIDAQFAPLDMDAPIADVSGEVFEPDGGGAADVPLPNPDLNEDGQLNILVIGTNRSILDRGEPFSPDRIAGFLANILDDDPALDLEVNVVAEDIYRTEVVRTGYGQRGDDYDWPYHCHSLAQYYYWPTGRDARMANLQGDGDHDWDQVILVGDPHLVSTLPGFHAFGVNKVAQRVHDGGAQPRLLMPWPRAGDPDRVNPFVEHSRRTGQGARVDLPVIPAGVAWAALPAAQQDNSVEHPTPNGAYLAAAAIYAQLFDRSASNSRFVHDDAIADAAAEAVRAEVIVREAEMPRDVVTAFQAGGISDRVLTYNHTGTSSERGILRGLRWVLGQANVRLENRGAPPLNFNYGRANTEFEAHKRYRVAPDEFQFSLGFPMQDNSNHGNNSMLFGLDKRRSDVENGTDLGVARKMARDNELPHARAVPIRSLFVQMKDRIPELSAYADGWHMNHDLDKATGAFMYTLLTGHCALPDEPDDRASGAWRAWLAHKTGYETAWQLMHLTGRAPCFRVLPESVDSIAIRAEQDTRLFVSFANPPRAEVTVTASADLAASVDLAPAQMVFTPENFSTPQTLVMRGQLGEIDEGSITITLQTRSDDIAFDGLNEHWTYTLEVP